MMKRAWDAYVKEGWGSNELNPQSHSGSASQFGFVVLVLVLTVDVDVVVLR
jgi:hypothetical protein